MASGGGDIAYYTVPVIPTFKGGQAKMGRDLDKVFGAGGKRAGDALTTSAAAAIARDKSIEKAVASKAKAADRLADAVGKARVAEKQYYAARETGSTTRMVAAEEKLASARRKIGTETRAVTAATRELERASKSVVDTAGRSGGGGMGGALGRALFGSSGASGLSSMAGSAGSGAATALKGGIAGVLTVGAGALIVAPFIKGMQAAFDTGINLDRVANTFSGVINTGDMAKATAQTNEMRAASRALGSDTKLAGVSATDAANAMLELAKGGMTADQAMDAARGTLQLATAGQLDAAEAAKIQSAAINMFSLNATDATRVADLLAASANASSADVTDLGMALQQGGSVAAGFGTSIEDTLTALTMFSRMGINGSDAGTMLKTSLQAITDQGKPAQGAIDELGLSLYDAQGKFVGVESMMKQVAEASKNMSQEQFQAATNVLFGSDAMRASMVAASGGAEAWDSAAEAVRRQGAAADMAAANMQGMPGIMEAIDNTAEGMKLSVYDSFEMMAQAAGGSFLGSMQTLSDWMGSHKADMIGFFGDVGEAAVHTVGIMLAFGAGVTRALALTVNAFGDTYGAATKFVSGVNRLLGRDDVADSLLKDAEAAYGWADGLYAAADGMDAAVNDTRNFGDSIDGIAKRAQEAARFSDALGGAIASIKGKDIVLKDNTPEVIAKIDKTKYAIETLPNGEVKIVPLTDEALATMNAWRKSQGEQPVDVPIAPKLDAAALKAQIDRVFGAMGAPPANPAAPPGAGIGSLLTPPGRAAGGVAGRTRDGRLFGPGTGTSDSILGINRAGIPTAFVSNGEGIVTKRAMDNGGDAVVRALNSIHGFAGGGQLGDAGGLQPYTAQLRALIAQTFPMITDIGGYRSPDGYNEHSSGRALDVMIPGWQSPQGIALGNMIAQWALSIPGIERVMWQQSIITPGGATPIGDRGSPTANHMDHVHIFTDQNPPGAMPIPPSASMMGMNGAFGMGGGGAAMGYGSGGGGGSYVVDQDRVRKAEQDVTDADAKVAIQEQQLAELKADATESQKMQAKDEVRRAKIDAQEARNDLAKAKQGDFKEGKGGGGSGGAGDLDPIGGIMSSFFKETFGLDGSLFPDIENLGPVKLLKGLLGIKFTPQGDGSYDGKGGAGPFGQFPGFSSPGGGTSGGGSFFDAATSMIPFGMIPNGAPPGGMPQAGQPGGPMFGAPGFGAPPGPEVIPNVDQSMHVTVAGNADGDTVNKFRRELQWTPRGLTHSSPTNPGMG